MTTVLDRPVILLYDLGTISVRSRCEMLQFMFVADALLKRSVIRLEDLGAGCLLSCSRRLRYLIDRPVILLDDLGV